MKKERKLVGKSRSWIEKKKSLWREHRNVTEKEEIESESEEVEKKKRKEKKRKG